MQRLTLSWRLYWLVLLSVGILAASMTFSLFQSYASAERERKAGLAQMNDVALAVLKRYQAMEAAGRLSRDQAQAEAKTVIAAMRYGGGKGYFWINDMTPRMIMHPIKPEMNGKDLSADKDPNGKFLFVEFVKTVQASKSGFVDYYWPKPGADEPVEKFSHVAGFEPWGWVVGTGVYVDDLHALFWRDAERFALICGGSVLLLFLGALFVVRSVTGPIGSVKEALQALAEGQVGVEIPCREQKNEIGEMARALAVLRNSVEERTTLQLREAEQQRNIAAERSDSERMLAASASRQAEAMSALGRALEELASGNLAVQIGSVAPDFAKLKADFDAAAAALRDTIGGISQTSLIVRDSAAEISAATGNLAKRTEQQAATLEETAAALDQITATVKTASQRALEARAMVNETKSSAARSGDIVRNAIDAMGRIEESSNRIGQIISVVDEIAFQTNLLALNAGVEAARAGEAGRGFAVVAQEVRELAQRSATAAKEIKTLVSGSAREVESGVALVRSTGDALVEIAQLVEKVNGHVESIATAAREQSSGLEAINVSVNQMDQMTQQNAGMVEETTAASHTLAEQSLHLQHLLSVFRLERGSSSESDRLRAA